MSAPSASTFVTPFVVVETRNQKGGMLLAGYGSDKALDKRCTGLKYIMVVTGATCTCSPTSRTPKTFQTRVIADLWRLDSCFCVSKFGFWHDFERLQVACRVPLHWACAIVLVPSLSLRRGHEVLFGHRLLDFISTSSGNSAYSGGLQL